MDLFLILQMIENLVYIILYIHQIFMILMILNNHFTEIYQQNTIEKIIKPKKKIFKTIYIA